MTSTTKKMRAYVIEDSLPLATLYTQMLNKMGFESQYFISGHEGLDAIYKEAPDLLVLDMQLPDMHGTEILEKLKSREVHFPRIVVTGHGSVETAVDAMRLGAIDYLEKPFTAERLQTTVENSMEHVHLKQVVKVIRTQIERDGYAGFVGRSLPMQVVYRIIDSAATSRASVLITGESGTGKELCAQAIHEKSDRANNEFVAVNCGAIPRELFESEIFGHVKGAFSGATSDRLGAAEKADGGTLFLDEIGEMDMDLQVKLLRFVQTGTFQRVGSNQTMKVNVRFVCATNKDPLELIENGKFREDLYYRINVIPINMPALRDRETDIQEIAQYFLKTYTAEEGRDFQSFTPEVEDLLLHYDWPGNVRQLSNVIHNTVLLNNGESVTVDMLPDPFGTDSAQAAIASKQEHKSRQPVNASRLNPTASPTTIDPLWKAEKRIIENAIEHFEGNIPVAAAHLGVSASTIYRKIKVWESQV